MAQETNGFISYYVNLFLDFTINVVFSRYYTIQDLRKLNRETVYFADSTPLYPPLSGLLLPTSRVSILGLRCRVLWGILKKGIGVRNIRQALPSAP